ncbi:hypothetical protein T06_1165 [Trichinella sp. T6]|nr:hypothetical protein T06_1165 [Trichinella sp. T6]
MKATIYITNNIMAEHFNQTLINHIEKKKNECLKQKKGKT